MFVEFNLLEGDGNGKILLPRASTGVSTYTDKVYIFTAGDSEAGSWYVKETYEEAKAILEGNNGN